MAVHEQIGVQNFICITVDRTADWRLAFRHSFAVSELF